MATKKGGTHKAGKPKAAATKVRKIKEIIIEVPHDEDKETVHELVKAALHKKSVTDAVEERNPVVVQVVDNGFIRKGGS
jgi:hypothetical protein